MKNFFPKQVGAIHESPYINPFSESSARPGPYSLPDGKDPQGLMSISRISGNREKVRQAQENFTTD